MVDVDIESTSIPFSFFTEKLLKLLLVFHLLHLCSVENPISLQNHSRFSAKYFRLFQEKLIRAKCSTVPRMFQK